MLIDIRRVQCVKLCPAVFYSDFKKARHHWPEEGFMLLDQGHVIRFQVNPIVGLGPTIPLFRNKISQSLSLACLLREKNLKNPLWPKFWIDGRQPNSKRGKCSFITTCIWYNCSTNDFPPQAAAGQNNFTCRFFLCCLLKRSDGESWNLRLRPPLWRKSLVDQAFKVPANHTDNNIIQTFPTFL